MTRWQNLQKSNLEGSTFGFLWHHCLDWIVPNKNHTLQQSSFECIFLLLRMCRVTFFPFLFSPKYFSAEGATSPSRLCKAVVKFWQSGQPIFDQCFASLSAALFFPFSFFLLFETVQGQQVWWFGTAVQERLQTSFISCWAAACQLHKTISQDESVVVRSIKCSPVYHMQLGKKILMDMIPSQKAL